MVQFSVIIPTYNRTKYIREAVASVYRQSFTNWEIVMVDDGSDVPAITLFRDLADDTRFTYHYQKNRGLGEARRVGAELARGEYICYLDDDDYYLPNHLATVYASIRSTANRPALYKTGLLRLYPDGTQKRSVLYEANTSAMEQHWTLMDGMFSYAIPRDVALQIPSIQYYFCEDFNWLGRLMVELPVIQIPAFTLVYRWHGNNRTGAITEPAALDGAFQAVGDLYAYPGVKELIRKSTYQRMMAHQALHYARACLRQRRYHRAYYGVRKSLPYAYPRSWYEIAYTIFFTLRQVLVWNGDQRSPT